MLIIINNWFFFLGWDLSCRFGIMHLKGLCTFWETKHNVHRFTLNLQCHENNFRLTNHETKIILACKNVFSWHCFTHFSKTTGKLSTIIIFKRYKFNVNLWTLGFVLQKVPKSFTRTKLHLSKEKGLCPGVGLAWAWLDADCTTPSCTL